MVMPNPLMVEPTPAAVMQATVRSLEQRMERIERFVLLLFDALDAISSPIRVLLRGLGDLATEIRRALARVEDARGVR